ncbi:MAG: Uma2 family endonuclease, partial [Streptococcaceae bacterium]|nr:Uma2 family endonuclease [Streptococcaceae bacterium]
MGLMEMEKKLFTYEEYRALELPQGQDAEFVEGEIIMRYRPTLEHQEILGNLFYALKDYLKGKPCKVLPEAEVDLFANQTQIRIPDILINCKNERDKRTHIEGAPEIVIEIVSKSSITQDYIIKTAAYQQAGVKE